MADDTQNATGNRLLCRRKTPAPGSRCKWSYYRRGNQPHAPAFKHARRRHDPPKTCRRCRGSGKANESKGKILRQKKNKKPRRGGSKGGAPRQKKKPAFYKNKI